MVGLAIFNYVGFLWEAHLESLLEAYRKYKALWNYHRGQKLFSYWAALKLLWNNRKVAYKAYRLSDAQRFKHSDTIFILGSGPSLNSLSPEELRHINEQDSLGLSWSFLKTEIRTKYHLFFWHLTEVFPCYEKVFSPYREAMKDVAIFVSNYEFAANLHPRLIPQLFPPEPKICSYARPPLIGVEERPFSDQDFERSFFYRNAMTMAIHLAVQMGYKKIVLLGLDPDKTGYFWEGHPLMKPISDIHERDKVTYKIQDQTKYYYMYSEPGRVHTFDTYLRCAESYLRRCRDSQLYVSHPSNVFYPQIPAYFKSGGER
jgi:hypothetical protein